MGFEIRFFFGGGNKIETLKLESRNSYPELQNRILKGYIEYLDSFGMTKWPDR